MLRPTQTELLLGLQRTIGEAMLPELTSPYAQGQAASAMGMLGLVAVTLAATHAYDAAEIEDLRSTLAAIGQLRAANASTPELRSLAASLVDGDAKGTPPVRREMEAAMSQFAAALALKQLDESIAGSVRKYLRRHLERMTVLLGAGTPR